MLGFWIGLTVGTLAVAGGCFLLGFLVAVWLIVSGRLTLTLGREATPDEAPRLGFRRGR